MQKEQPTRVGRRLAAIVAADVAGYSRLMGLDEVGTARTLREHRKVAEKGKWDLLEQVGVLSGPEAFRPLEEGGCTLDQQTKSN